MKTATGKVIKAIRLHFNYTQGFVADKLNITITTLANIENGRVGLDMEKLSLLAKVFGMASGTILQLILEVRDTEEDDWLPSVLKHLKTSLNDNGDKE